MNETGQLFLHLGSGISERSYDAAAAILAPVALLVGWFAAKAAIASAILASIPTPVRLTNVPSIDCLMQYAQCLP
jgi:hypothetical protein